MKVLITGGSRGIGAAAALLFAQRGWDVAIGYHTNEAAAHTVVEKVKHLCVRACAIQADVSCPEQAAPSLPLLPIRWRNPSPRPLKSSEKAVSKVLQLLRRQTTLRLAAL